MTRVIRSRLLRKSIGVLCVAALSVAFCGTPATAAEEPDLTADAFRNATWNVWVKWNNGISGSFQITFRNDGTFVTDTSRGRWFQIDKRAVFQFDRVGGGIPDWSIVYALTVNDAGTGFTGIQGWGHTSGKPKGVHSATRMRHVAEANRLVEDSGAATGVEKALGNKKNARKK